MISYQLSVLCSGFLKQKREQRNQLSVNVGLLSAQCHIVPLLGELNGFCLTSSYNPLGLSSSLSA